MQQPTLFSSDAYGNPVSRATDPVTSHEAEKAVTESGQRSRHAEIVLAVVRKHPQGLTYVELWHACTKDEQADLGDAIELMRRLNDLVKRGDVAKGDIRMCAVKGSKMTTWRAAK